MLPMSDAIKVALIAAIPLLIAQVVSIFLSLRNHEQGKEIHVMINNRMSELLQAARSLSHNEGVTEGGAAVRDAIRKGETGDKLNP